MSTGTTETETNTGAELAAAEATAGDEAVRIQAPAGVLSDRDIRARRPAFLSSLLSLDNYRRFMRVASLLVLDIASVYWAIFSALALKEIIRGDYSAQAVATTAGELAPFAALVTVLLFAKSDLYGAREARPGFSRIVTALFQVMLVSLVFAVVQGYEFSSFYLFYGTLFFASLYISGTRLGYELVTGRILRALGYQRRAVLVGTGDQIDAVAHALENSTNTKYDTIGFISLTPRPANGLTSLGELSDLPRRLEEHAVDEVIIADPDFPQEHAVELIDQCHRRGVTVRIAPSTMEVLVHRAEFVPGEAVPLFELRPPVFEGFDYVVKRSFDVVGAGLLIAALSPMLALISAMIAISSRGPVIYRSVRPGIGGQPFSCLKFRTMHHDADQRQGDLEDLNEMSGPIFKIRDDPRLTPVGKLLRRFSLDELPQLINVVRGEMSLVGPRPLPMRDFARLEDWHKKRYLVLPGITGLWQVSGRSDLDFDDMVRLDFLYLERWSVFVDLSVLLKTVPAVIARRGAY